MNVFISWSGDRSKHIAEALRTWLPKVIQVVEPWMSHEDIDSGSRWSNEVRQKLAESKFGIVCITPENQNNPWILFEAGALSKTLENTFVCPFLFELEPSQISGPLSQFQARKSDRDGTHKIIKTLNNALAEQGLENDELDEIFEVWWPRLDQKIQDCPSYSGEKISKRSNDEILTELVENTREQLRREEIRLQRSLVFEEKMDVFINFLDQVSNSEYSKFMLKPPLEAGSLSKLMAQNPDPSSNVIDMKKLVEGMKDIRDYDDKTVHEILKPRKKKQN